MRGDDGKKNICTKIDLYTMKVNKKIGLTFSWGATHKRGGRLISRHVSLQPPELTCPKFSCWVQWQKDIFLCSLISLYHQRRVKYAEKYPDMYIAWKYRTGEDSPTTIIGALWALFVLKTRRKMTWLKTKL